MDTEEDASYLYLSVLSRRSVFRKGKERLRSAVRNAERHLLRRADADIQKSLKGEEICRIHTVYWVWTGTLRMMK